MAQRRSDLAGRAWLRPWLAVGLAAWITIGVALVGRANAEGLVDDITLSPYHLVGYAGLAVLGIYVAWAFFRALGHGRWRSAFPPLYGGLGVAFVLILLWIVADAVWRSTLGIRFGIEEGLSPPRLLIPVALVFLAAGPVREAIAARAERGLARGELAGRWAGVVAAAVLVGALGLTAFNPLNEPNQDFATNPGIDSSEIWTMAADGSDQRRLLAAKGDGVDYSLPAWSPDGTRIAYTVWTNEGGVAQNVRNGDQSTAIWTMAADGTDRRLVVDGLAEGASQAWTPAWSPDGEWIAYTLTPRAGPAAAPIEPQAGEAPGGVSAPSVVAGSSIWMAHPDGTGKQRLTREGIDAIAGWFSPDGTKLAYIVGQAGAGSDVYVADVSATGLANERAIAADSANDWGPSWSPDGTRIAFNSNRKGYDGIWIAALDGSSLEELRVVANPGPLAFNDWVPVFSPDGTRIAFVSDRSGDADVWSVATDGSDLRNLSDHPWHLDGQWSVAWSPDGGRLAYAVAPFGDAAGSGWVREDLAAASSILLGLELAILALLLVAMGAPLGSFTVALTIVVALTALVSDDWRFVPAAVIAGLIVDLLVRSVRPRWRARVAAGVLPAVATLAFGLVLAAAGTLAWSVTLLLGVALITGLAGLGLAIAVERLFAPSPDVVPPPVAAEA